MSFKCHDCGVDTINEHFMVHDSLWHSVFGDQADSVENICIVCLERRMGRRLTKEDFTDFPINDLNIEWARTDTLINRLSN